MKKKITLSLSLVIGLNIVMWVLLGMSLKPSDYASVQVPRKDYLNSYWLVRSSVMTDLALCGALGIISYSLFVIGVGASSKKLKQHPSPRWLYISFSFLMFVDSLIYFTGMMTTWFPIYRFLIGLKIVSALIALSIAAVMPYRVRELLNGRD